MYCNLKPTVPHFSIVNLGFAMVYIIFQIFAQNKDLDTGKNPVNEAILRLP